MYTEPCYTSRDVWICQERLESVKYMNIEKFDIKAQYLLSPLVKGVKAFPSKKNATKLLDKMLYLGVITPYYRELAFIVVTEIRSNLKEGNLKKIKIYDGNEA